MSNIQPLLVSQALVARLTRDPSFFDKFAEFGSLRAPKPKTSTGCRSCKKQKAVQRSTATFLRILQSLSPDKLNQFKQLAGAEKLQFNAFNSAKGVYEVVII